MLTNLFLMMRVTLRLLITCIEFVMVLRALLSWFPIDEDSALLRFLYAVTEPVLFPVRALLARLGWFQDFPLDVSFFLTFILLSVLRMLL